MMEQGIRLKDTTLSVRAQHVLASLGCRYVEDVLLLDIGELYHVLNFGTKTLDEIEGFIKWYSREQGTQSDEQKSTTQWVKDNGLDNVQVLVYVKKNDIPVNELQISARACNILRINRIELLSEIIFSGIQDLKALDYMEIEIAKEIAACCRAYLREHKESILQLCNDSTTDAAMKSNNSDIFEIRKLLCQEEFKEEVTRQYGLNAVGIEKLQLSVRTYNALKRARINTVADVLQLYPNEVSRIRNLGQKSIEEICDTVELYIYKIITAENALSMVEKFSNNNQTENIVDIHQLTVKQIVNINAYADKAKEYLKANDVPLEKLGLSARATNGLNASGLSTLYEIVCYGIQKLYAVKNLGAKSIEEITSTVNTQLEKMQPYLVAYCLDDNVTLIDDKRVQALLLRQFEKAHFAGLHFKEFRERLPDSIPDQQIKSNIGKLLEKGSLEYVDFCCYKVYPSVFDILSDSELQSELYYPEYLLRKYSGETLDSIGKDVGITRERVRQICVKAAKKLRLVALTRKGAECFDEDYYAYLYQNYDTDEELWTQYLHIDRRTYTYLKNEYVKGNKAISDAIADPQIELNLKYRINNYQNKDKILADGLLLDRKRGVLEEYVLKKYYSEVETDYDSFCRQYQLFLEENNLSEDDRLVYSKNVIMTRKNRISALMVCLWKFGERLRYYDINSRDYDELLEELDLEGFENTEISTLKLFEEHTAIMSKYDIRDHYELHNLLKKIIPNGSYHGISFTMQPMIGFGDYNRSDIVFQTIRDHSPISSGNLLKILRNEYGYEIGNISACLSTFSQYSHNGVFNIDNTTNVVPEEHKEALLAVLAEDFYYISEIKKIYVKLFEDADEEAINPYTLKMLGFQVFNTYAIQHFSSAYQYFRHLLTKDDVYFITPYRKRYGTIMMYSQVLMDLRRDYEIFVFGEDQVVTINRLSRLKIQKSDIKRFCDKVDFFIPTSEYFTIASLKKQGFSAELFDLGFDDLFYGGILSVDSRFAYQRIFGSIVLIKNDKEEQFNKKTLMQSLLRMYESVGIEEYMDDFYEKYGIRIPEKYEVTEAVRGTELYYDPIMERVYRNKEYYYAELDD